MYEEPDLSIIRKKIEGVFGENDEVEQEEEEGVVQTSAINGKQRIAASASDGQRTMTIEARVKASQAEASRATALGGDASPTPEEDLPDAKEVKSVDEEEVHTPPAAEGDGTEEDVQDATEEAPSPRSEDEAAQAALEGGAGERARELRREYLRRRVYMLLKEAELEKEEILDYIAARCQRDAGGADVSQVAIAIFEGWARELETYGKEDGERAEHVLDMIARWKAWLKKQAADESAA